MFAGQAPPFGWYCNASKSRTSAPRSTAICVTSPVAPGWFVDSSPRSSATRKHRPPAARTTVVATIVWSPQRARQPFSVRASSASGDLGKVWMSGALGVLAQRGRDRMSRAVADLQQALARRAAAAREAIAAVLARELDAELLEPVDRGRRLAGEDLDELPVGGLVRGLPDVVCVLLRRVVLAEGCLDPALRLGRVARLQRPLRGERDPRAGPLRGDGRREAGGPATDHEHVKRGVRHDHRTLTRFD